MLHGVLVTQVQGAPAAPVDEGREPETASAGARCPRRSLMVTLARHGPPDAEPVVFGIEHGTLWLSLEPEGADTRGTDVITQGNVYGKSYA